MHPSRIGPLLLAVAGCTQNPSGPWFTRATPTGTELSYGSATLELSSAVNGTAVVHEEWFHPAHHRLQHGFTFDTRPSHSGPLAIDVALTGIDGVPHRTERGITWMDGRRVVATYDDLLAWDSNGRDLPAHMQLRCTGDPTLGACQVRLEVDDERARYPITVDPYVAVAEIPGSNSFEHNMWAQDDYYFAPALTTNQTEVWEFIGDSPVYRGPLPFVQGEPHQVSARQGRAILVREDNGQLEEWAVDPATELFERFGPVPLPPEIYGSTDVVAGAVAWTPDGLLVHAAFVYPGFGPLANGYQSLYLFDDSSGPWQVVASQESFDWGTPIYQTDLFATSANGLFTIANHSMYPRRSTVRMVVQNGASLDIVEEIDPGVPGSPNEAHVAMGTGERVVWPERNWVQTTDLYITDTDGLTTVQPLDHDSRSRALSPSGAWLATVYVGDIDILTIADDHTVTFVESMPPATPDSEGVAGLTFLDDAHLLVLDVRPDPLDNVTYLYKLTQPPTLTALPATVDEGATLPLTDTLSVEDLDDDDADLTLQLVALPAYGDVLVDGIPQTTYAPFAYQDLLDGLVSYVHHGDESTEDTVEIEACDPDMQCTAVGVVELTILPVNDPPVLTALTAPVDEGDATTIDVVAQASDVDSDLDPASPSVLTPPTAGTAMAAPDGTLTYTHDGSETLGDAFEVQLCDVDGACVAADVVVEVAPVNDAPSLEDATQSLDEGGSLTLDLSTIATDPDSDLASGVITVTAAPVNGTASASGPRLTYDHDGSETTSDALSYELCDPEGACVTAALTLTITPVDDPPIPADDAVTLEQGGAALVDVLANDSDADSDTLTILVAAEGANTAASVAAGQVSLVHDGTGTDEDTVQLQICDATTCVDSALTVTVTPSDDGSGSDVDDPDADVDADASTDTKATGCGCASGAPSLGWLPLLGLLALRRARPGWPA